VGIVQISVCWNATPLNPLKINHDFGVKWRHLQGRRISQAKREAGSNQRYIPENKALHIHRRDNHKSYMWM
jgi:hypothetical protein